MINHEENLKSVIDQQKQVLLELQDLNNQVNLKRETLFKLQGIIEYLTGIGMDIPEKISTIQEQKGAIEE